MRKSLPGTGAGRRRYEFSFPDSVATADIKLQLPSPVGEREVVAVVDVYDPAGTNMAAETKGLNYSASLKAMYRYVPQSGEFDVQTLAHLEFPRAAKSVAVTLLDWKTTGPAIAGKKANVMGVFRIPLPEPSGQQRNCIVFAEGEVN